MCHIQIFSIPAPCGGSSLSLSPCQWAKEVDTHLRVRFTNTVMLSLLKPDGRNLQE